MDAIQALTERKSVRAYREAQVPEAALETVLQAGSRAPVAGVFQITVIQNRSLLDRINDAAKSGMLGSGVPFMVERASLPGYEPLYGAPTLFLISSPADLPTASANAACAAENMIIAATALGLGSCYLGSPRLAFSGAEGGKLAAEARIPSGYVFNCGVIVGYAGGEAFAAAKRKPPKIVWVR